MPPMLELRAEQKKRLYQLLAYKKGCKEENGILNGFINQTIAEMEKEDVSYVKELVEGRFRGKSHLYQLLAVQKTSKEKNQILDDFVNQAMAEMEQEDISHIRELVEAHYGQRVN